MALQLTLGGDYAVRIAVDLAERPGRVVRTRDLSRRTGVPVPYLRKLVQALGRAGLVHTRPGGRGGVALGSPPHTVTLRQVIEAVEGPVYLNRCVARPGWCPRDAFCPVHPVWHRLQAAFCRELDAVRLSALVASPPDPGEERAC